MNKHPEFHRHWNDVQPCFGDCAWSGQVAGAMQLFAAFQARAAGHVLLYLPLGALDIAIGFVLVEESSAGALAVA